MSVSAIDSKSAELVGRLDRLPFSRWHKNLFTLCFLGVMFDACDFALFGMALPPVAREFGLNQAQAGLLATVGLVGAFLGALFWGTISDYIGRRTSFATTIGIFSLFTGLVGASWNVLSLSIFRFISNFGLGGEVPVALTLTSEYSPSKIRGRMTGSMLAAFPMGLALAAALAYFIIPTYGWRTVFVIGVIPAVLLFVVRLVMPESVRYLVSRGRVACVFPSLVRARNRPVDLRRYCGGRLGQSGRVRLERGLRQRALSDPPARDGRRMVLRHWPRGFVPSAGCGWLHAYVWSRWLRSKNVWCYCFYRIQYSMD